MFGVRLECIGSESDGNFTVALRNARKDLFEHHVGELLALLYSPCLIVFSEFGSIRGTAGSVGIIVMDLNGTISTQQAKLRRSVT